MNRNLKLFASLLAIASMITYVGCSDDDEPASPIDLSTLMIGDKDLNGATFATGVNTTDNIVAEFSTDVDAATATSSNIALKRGTVAVPVTITVQGKTVTINPDENLLTGTKYDLSINTSVKSTQGQSFEGVSTSFTTTGVGLDTSPQAASQVLYLQFDNSIADVTGNHTKTFEQGISYVADRFGNANSAIDFGGAAAAGQGDLVEISGDKLINASTTISLWFKVNSADYEGSRFMFGTSVERAYFLEVGSGGVDWLKFATSHKVDASGTPDHNFATAWTDPNGDGTVGGQTLFDYTGAISDLTTNKWVQLVMTFDATTSLKTIYLDGQKIMQVDIDKDATEWILKDLALATKDDANNNIAGIEPVLALGFAGSRGNTATEWANFSAATNTYKGSMDDFRIFSKALSESEVTALYNSEKP